MLCTNRRIVEEQKPPETYPISVARVSCICMRCTRIHYLCAMRLTIISSLATCYLSFQHSYYSRWSHFTYLSIPSGVCIQPSRRMVRRRAPSVSHPYPKMDKPSSNSNDENDTTCTSKKIHYSVAMCSVNTITQYESNPTLQTFV